MIARFLALLLVAFTALAAAAQTTYYVNGACGDDAWAGANPARQAPDGPKATIQAGIDASGNGDATDVTGVLQQPPCPWFSNLWCGRRARGAA